jgi:hypothetical protein
MKRPERVKDGQMEVLMRKGNYVKKHIWLYEFHNGTIPKGKKLIFKDGNPLNCVLGNLALEDA